MHVCFATLLSEARYIAYLSEARYIAYLFERDALHGVSDNRCKSNAQSRKKTHITATIEPARIMIHFLVNGWVQNPTEFEASNIPATSSNICMCQTREPATLNVAGNIF